MVRCAWRALTAAFGGALVRNGTLFVLGMGLGLGLGIALGVNLGLARPASGAIDVLEAEPVRGVAGRDERGSAANAASTAVLDALPPLLPEPGRVPEAAEVASAALLFTVHVRGDDSYGAGIVVDRQGHILTCLHVVDGAEQLTVDRADGRQYPVQVIAVDRALDIALLEAAPEVGAPAPVGHTRDIRLGDALYAMGAPRKMKFSFSRGIASFVGRRFAGAYYLQTDLPLNGGSSGGPVMNARGEVVAMSSFVLKDSEGLGFALPLEYALLAFADVLGGELSRVAAERRAELEAWVAARERPPAWHAPPREPRSEPVHGE